MGLTSTKDMFDETLSPASRALANRSAICPGVPLRSTPGFMLTPASRVLNRHEKITAELFSLIQPCLPALKSGFARQLSNVR
jgi:hypothetical protein